jgi:hypothetical protein
VINGQQQGGPAQLAATLVQIVDQEQPRVRRVACADGDAAGEQKAREPRAEVDAYRDLSTALALDAREPSGSAR